MQRAIANVDIKTYASLARRMWPGTVGIAVCDQSGAPVQVCNKKTAALVEAMQTSHSNWAAECSEMMAFKLDEQNSALIIVLDQNEQQINAFLVWIVEAGHADDFGDYTDTYDRVMPLCASLRNDIRLNSELDLMAEELAERYEELNLVYHTDDQVSYFREGHEALRTLVQNCSDYLDTGLAVLSLRSKNVMVTSAVSDEVDVEVVRQFANEEVYDWVEHRNDTLLVNNAANNPVSLNRNLPYRIMACPIPGPSGKVDGMLMMVNPFGSPPFSNSDRNLVSVMAKKAAKIVQGSYDGLTGLLNRASFDHLLDSELAVARKRAGEHSVLHINLDNLHRFNDTLGHEAGDMVIRQAALTVVDELRDTDSIARIGGDEIGVLIRDCSEEQARRIGQKLVDAIAAMSLDWNGDDIKITASVGIASLDESSLNGEEVLKRTVVACDIAKENGGNQFQVYALADSRLQEREKHMWTVGKVQTALEQDQFVLYGQVIEPLREGADRHIEILLRMREDDQIVAPQAFLPASERYQLMQDIDRWVVNKAFTMIAEHQKILGNNLPVFGINLSGQSFCKEEFLDFVLKALIESGVSPQSICFEITETAAVSNLEQAKLFIAALRRVGCTFALDDFGAGLSSFGYLKSFDVQYLKIDGALVRDMADDPITEAMVASVNQVGHVMGLKTIAEYVESPRILAMLAAMGVDYAQGYALGKPQSLAEMLQSSATVQFEPVT